MVSSVTLVAELVHELSAPARALVYMPDLVEFRFRGGGSGRSLPRRRRLGASGSDG